MRKILSVLAIWILIFAYALGASTPLTSIIVNAEIVDEIDEEDEEEVEDIYANLSEETIIDTNKNPLVENLAYKKTITASSIQNAQHHAAEKANDNDNSSFWASKTGEPVPAWICVDFGREMLVNKAYINFRNSILAYKIQTSNDKRKWVDVFIGGTSQGGKTIYFRTQKARYVRFLFTKTRTEGESIGIFEIGIYCEPTSKLNYTPFGEPGFAQSKELTDKTDEKVKNLSNYGVMLFPDVYSLYYQGEYHRLDNSDIKVSPKLIEGATYLPLKAVFAFMGGVINQNRDNSQISLFYNGKSVKFLADKNEIWINNKKLDANAGFKNIDEKIYLSADITAEILNKKLYRSNTGLVVLSDKEDIFKVPNMSSEDLATRAERMLKMAPCNVADFKLVHDTMVTDIGFPAMISPGSKMPYLTIHNYYNGKMTATIFLGDEVFKSFPAEDTEAGNSKVLNFGGKAEKEGLYRIEIVFEIGEVKIPYNFYFSVVDTSQFGKGKSAIAYMGDDDKLKYTPDYMGNRLVDFSYAGYMGGGVPLPDVGEVIRLSPKNDGSDDAIYIQEALDKLEEMPLNDDGFRGAVVLDVGRFNLKTNIIIKGEGIVLKGSGSDKRGTILQCLPNVRFFMGATSGSLVRGNEKVPIMDGYVPSGSHKLTVLDASKFEIGDKVIISKKPHERWVTLFEMHELYRGGGKQIWPGWGEFVVYRTIKDIIGDTIIVEAPIVDALDTEYLGFPCATIEKYSLTEISTKIGIENLSIAYTGNIGQTGAALRIDYVQDSWVKSVNIYDSATAIISGGRSARITLWQVETIKTAKTTNLNGAPADFMLTTTQILAFQCKAPEGMQSFGYAMGSITSGPIAIVESRAGGVFPHMRWTTGILVDNSKAKLIGADFINRGSMGGGHGWTTGWSVLWNMEAEDYHLFRPLGSMNYAIGCIAEQSTKYSRGEPGIHDSYGTHVTPVSLYRQQLKDRLGVELPN